MEEIWRDIVDYEGYYEVSILGRIRRRGYNKFYLGKSGQPRGLRIKEPTVDNYGYLHIRLHKNNRAKDYRIHTLVAHAFPEICGEPFPGAVVNHLDENPTNNVATNLRFVTQRENVNWGTHNERMIKNRKGKNACKPVLQYTLNGDFVKEYPSCNEAARQTGIDDTTMWRCCNGIKESVNGYIWKYKPQP